MTLNGFLAMIVRDFLRFWKEPLRIPARMIQPLLYLVALGAGHGGSSVLGLQGYQRHIFPGVIGLSLMTSAAFNGANIVVDREQGFLKAVLVAPVSRASLAFGKVASGALLAVFQALPLVLFAPFLGIGLGPLDVLNVVLAMLASAAVLSAIAVAVASRLDLSLTFSVTFNVVMLPMYFLSGALFPLHSAPSWLQVLACLDPMAYAVELMRAAMHGQTFIPPARAAAVLALLLGLLVWSSVRAFEQGEDL